MEISDSTPVVALFLELLVSKKIEIEQKQLFVLKGILEKDPDDPFMLMIRIEQLNYNFEENWANYGIFFNCDMLIFLLNDENIKKMTLT